MINDNFVGNSYSMWGFFLCIFIDMPTLLFILSVYCKLLLLLCTYIMQWFIIVSVYIITLTTIIMDLIFLFASRPDKS